jgi:hypothetical protein
MSRFIQVAAGVVAGIGSLKEVRPLMPVAAARRNTWPRNQLSEFAEHGSSRRQNRPRSRVYVGGI